MDAGIALKEFNISMIKSSKSETLNINEIQISFKLNKPKKNKILLD